MPELNLPTNGNNGNGNTENVVRRVMKNDITLLISIVVTAYAFLSMVILPLQKVSQRVDYIEDNHLSHIQDDIEEIKNVLKTNDAHDADVDKKLERILTILEAK
jgi:hypothetical protein